jgi:hypothetical protein
LNLWHWTVEKKELFVGRKSNCLKINSFQRDLNPSDFAKNRKLAPTEPRDAFGNKKH